MLELTSEIRTEPLVVISEELIQDPGVLNLIGFADLTTLSVMKKTNYFMKHFSIFLLEIGILDVWFLTHE